MDALKGIAEIIDHILYELLALLIPGAAMLLTITWLLGPEAWKDGLDFVGKQPWLAGGMAYLLGYVVQGISRPVVVAFEWLLRRAAWLVRLVTWPLRRFAPRPWGWFAGRVNAMEAALLRRQAHGNAPAQNAHPVDLTALARERWEKRLGVPAGHALAKGEVRDLCFSELLSHRGRLDRFRAATSLTRGVATVAAAAFALVCYQIGTGARTPTFHTFLMVEGLVIAFYALLERADMYDRTWNNVLVPQFLSYATRPAEELQRAQPSGPAGNLNQG